MRGASSTSLTIRLSASRQLTLGLGGLHLGAIPCALANDLPAPVQGLVVLCVVLAALRHIELHGSGRAARSIVLLVWDGHGQWRLVQRNGQVLDACLDHGAYSHPLLVVLPFRTRGWRRSCVLIVPDKVDAECLRRLRVRLRCEPSGDGRSCDHGAVC
jgi:hypothetical protein